jgi:hypothetical protein
MPGIEFMIAIPELNILKEKWHGLPVSLKAMTKTTLFKAAVTTQNIARLETPVKTGRLRNSISIALTDNKAVVFTKVNYGVYVHQGTGIYGPHRAPIIPKQKKIMATTKNPGWGTRNKAGYYIIGKSVKGQRPNPFMKRAALMSRPLVIAEFKEMRGAFIREMKV